MGCSPCHLLWVSSLGGDPHHGGLILRQQSTRHAWYPVRFVPAALVASYFTPSDSSLRVSFRSHRDGARSASFHIPWTKTTREKGASVIVTARSDKLCPVKALENHLRVNRAVPHSAPLFAFATPGALQPWSHLIKSSFLATCDGFWSAANLAHVLGHSFRIGGAVELLLAGVPPDIVAATGGWTSLAFLLYWRRMEEILPMSTSRAYRRAHLDDLAKIFESFRVSQKIPADFVSACSDGGRMSSFEL